jgi:hypothetical protein
MAMMMEVISTDGASFATNDVIEKIMDKQIMEVMLNEMNSLAEYKENITVDFGLPQTPMYATYPHSAGKSA